jgi:hypothetical protein
LIFHLLLYTYDLLLLPTGQLRTTPHHTLMEVLQRLQVNGLVRNVDKYPFGLPALDFLAHSVSAAGLPVLKQSRLSCSRRA